MYEKIWEQKLQMIRFCVFPHEALSRVKQPLQPRGLEANQFLEDHTLTHSTISCADVLRLH